MAPVLVSCLLATLLLLHMSAKLQLQRAQTNLPYEAVSGLTGSDSVIIKTTALNYSTLAADLMWVAAIINHSELRGRNRHNEHLLDLGFTLSKVDPRFYTIYTWFPAAFLATTSRPSESDMGRIDDLVSTGMEAFPQDFYLPYSASLNYIGYSAGVSDARRIREVRRGRELMAHAATLSGAHDLTQGVYTWFGSRLAQLEGRKISTKDYVMEQIDLLAQTHVPLVRASALDSLRARSVPDSFIEKNLDQHTSILFQRQSELGYGYLNHELWLMLDIHD